MKRPFPAAYAAFLAMLLSLGGSSRAQTPVQLADIGDEPFQEVAYYGPSTRFIERAGVLYFLGHDGVHGQELWRTDGTSEGTTLVRDICPGYCFGVWSPEMVVLDGVLYFTADDGLYGDELWRSDGTREGTRMVADVVSRGQAFPRWLTAVNGRLFFVARTGPTTEEHLFVTDGTARGTRKIEAATASGSPLVDPVNLLAFGDRLLFFAEEGTHGFDLWITDGTDAGTSRVTDQLPGPSSSVILGSPLGRHYFGLVHEGLAYLGTSSALWITDGTAAGTRQLPFGPGARWPTYFTELAGEVYFQARTDALGSELWVTDGTVEGTELVADTEPGPGSSGPRPLGILGTDLYLAASSAATGMELWRTAGRGTGVQLAVEIDPGPVGGLAWTVFIHPTWGIGEERLLFFANDGVSGLEPWVTDGTQAGSAPLGDLHAGPNGSFRFPFATDAVAFFDGRWFFFALGSEYGLEPWVSDGTARGTVPLTRFHRQTSAIFQSLFFLLGEAAGADGRAFFQARDAQHGSELWVTNGSPGGTYRVMDLAPGPEDGVRLSWDPPQMVWVRDRLFFAGNPDQLEPTLWETDGTAGGTRPVLQPATGQPFTNPRYLVSFAGHLAFSSDQGVYRTDESSGAIRLTGSTRGSLLTPAGDRLFFAGSRLWVSGTAEDSAVSLGGGSDPHSLTPVDSAARSDLVGAANGRQKLFFVAETEAAGGELWISDGTSAGTSLVCDVRPGPGSSMTYRGETAEAPESLLAPLGSRVLLLADDGVHGEELWRSDGTEGGTVLLKDLLPGAASSLPRYLTAVPGGAYFVADDGVHGRELWWSNGSAAGTRMLADLVPGPEGSWPDELTAVGRDLFFSAATPAGGRELWRYRADLGTARQVVDLNPGEGSSTPMYLTPFKNRLFFFATDGESGFEPWVLRLDTHDGKAAVSRPFGENLHQPP